MLKKIWSLILRLLGLESSNTPSGPPITDPTVLPIDVKIVTGADGKKYKVTTYNDGTSKMEEIV